MWRYIFTLVVDFGVLSIWKDWLLILNRVEKEMYVDFTEGNVETVFLLRLLTNSSQDETKVCKNQKTLPVKKNELL